MTTYRLWVFLGWEAKAHLKATGTIKLRRKVGDKSQNLAPAVCCILEPLERWHGFDQPRVKRLSNHLPCHTLACPLPVSIPCIPVHPSHHHRNLDFPFAEFDVYLVIVLPLSINPYLLRLDTEQYDVDFGIFAAQKFPELVICIGNHSEEPEETSNGTRRFLLRGLVQAPRVP